MASWSNVFGANDTSADILVPLCGGGNDTNTEDLFVRKNFKKSRTLGGAHAPSIDSLLLFCGANFGPREKKNAATWQLHTLDLPPGDPGQLPGLVGR